MLKPIKIEKQYESSLERIYELLQIDLKPNSKNSDELEKLSILIKNYGHENYPIKKLNKCLG